MQRLEDENLVHLYFRQLLDAIEHCHSRGICHRDIKVREKDIITAAGIQDSKPLQQHSNWVRKSTTS